MSTGFTVVSDVFSASVSSSGVAAWTQNEDYGSNSTSNGTGGTPIWGTACTVYFSYIICVGGTTTGHALTAQVFFAKDQGIIGWFETGNGPVPTYWDDCTGDNGLYGYFICLGQGSPDVYSAEIDTPSTTTSTSTTETSSTSTTTTSTTSSPTKVTPDLITGISSANVTVGTEVHDTAGFTVYYPTGPGGTVTFNFYSGPGCTGQKTQLNTVDVTFPSSSFAGQSDFVTPTAPGTYSFQATYSGDPNDNPTMSSCETLTVTPSSSTSQTSTTTPTTGVGSGNDLVYVGVGVGVLILAGAAYAIVRRRGAGVSPPPPQEKPPPPPTQPPPPPPPPPTRPPLVAAPGVIPRNPCPPGTKPETDTTTCGEPVEMLLPGDARVDISGAYSFGEEDVEAAKKGLEKFEKGVLVASVLQGLTGVGEALSGVIEHFTTGKGSEAGAKGTTKLSEELKEAKSENGDMSVICPRAKFSLECVVTKECVDGYWKVTNRTLNMKMTADNLGPVTWTPEQSGRNNHVRGAGEIGQMLTLFQGWVDRKNKPAIDQMKACEEKCQKMQ